MTRPDISIIVKLVKPDISIIVKRSTVFTYSAGIVHDMLKEE